MKNCFARIGIVILGIMLLSSVCIAQDEINWKGAGIASGIIRGELRDMNFSLSLNVDPDLKVSGEATAEEGSAQISKMYFTDIDYKNNTRHVCLVIDVRVDYENPRLYILKGKTIQDRLYYGEVFMKRYEEGGEVEKALDLDKHEAIQFYENYEPESLMNAIKACQLLGCFKVEGDYVE